MGIRIGEKVLGRVELYELACIEKLKGVGEEIEGNWGD